jgi:hypothetical protein
MSDANGERKRAVPANVAVTCSGQVAAQELLADRTLPQRLGGGLGLGGSRSPIVAGHGAARAAAATGATTAAAAAATAAAAAAAAVGNDTWVCFEGKRVNEDYYLLKAIYQVCGRGVRGIWCINLRVVFGSAWRCVASRAAGGARVELCKW